MEGVIRIMYRKSSKKIEIIIIISLFLFLFTSLFVVNWLKENKEATASEEFEVNNEVNVIEPTKEEGLSIGNTAPDFEIETLDGMFKLSDIRGKGKKILLNFWTTWCPSCEEEMPDLQKLKDNQNDIEVIAVNLSSQESEFGLVKEFVDLYDLDLTIPLDKDGDIMSLYQIRPIPTSFFIDSKGHIADISFGPLTYEQLVEKFNQIK